MSIPALRQPKNMVNDPTIAKSDKITNFNSEPNNFLIITLSNGRKLVVATDAYNGILTASELYRCVFCETEMILDVLCKERHIQSENHKNVLQNYPHIEEFQENLIRKLNGGYHYCTLCNVVVSSKAIHKHLSTDVHADKLHQATTKVDIYQPNRTKKEQWPTLC